MNFERLAKADAELYSYDKLTEMILKEKTPLNTLELFTMIVDKLELGDEYLDDKLGDYYTLLSSDKKFIMDDGLWDLRERKKSDQIKQIVEEEEDFELEEDFEELIEEDEEDEEDEILDDEEEDFDFHEDFKHLRVYEEGEEE